MMSYHLGSSKTRVKGNSFIAHSRNLAKITSLFIGENMHTRMSTRADAGKSDNIIPGPKIELHNRNEYEASMKQHG